MPQIAIIGAGNLGCYLAAHLATAGHSVFFCVRRQVRASRIEDLDAPPIPYFLSDPPAAEIVLLTIKAQNTAEAMPWLDRLCAQGAPVAVIQNGIHHAERIAPYSAIPVLSYVYVEENNGVRRAFAPPRDHFTVPASEASQPFIELLRSTTLRVHQEAEFHTAAWRKLLHNCVSNPLTALSGRGLEILREPLYREWAERIIAEAVPVAQADGADVSVADGQQVLDVLLSYPPGTRTSMLQDREAGRPLEIEALNGAVISLGRRFGIPTPVNLELVERLSLRSEVRASG